MIEDKDSFVYDLVSVSKEWVYNPDVVTQINKLEFTSPKQKEVLQGLTMAHLSALRFYLVPWFIQKYVTDEDKVEYGLDGIEAEITQAITQDLQHEFVKQTKHVDVSEKNYWTFFNLVLMPIANDIHEAMLNPSLIWGENEHSGLNISGILGVVLRKVFQKQSIADIFSGTRVDLLGTLLPIVLFIDRRFKATIQGAVSVLKELN